MRKVRLALALAIFMLPLACGDSPFEPAEPPLQYHVQHARTERADVQPHEPVLVDRSLEQGHGDAVREPTGEESAVAKEIVGESLSDERFADLLWTVFMLPEFQLIR